MLLCLFQSSGISHARILVWVAIPLSRESSWFRDQTCIAGRFFTIWATREALKYFLRNLKLYSITQLFKIFQRCHHRAKSEILTLTYKVLQQSLHSPLPWYPTDLIFWCFLSCCLPPTILMSWCFCECQAICYLRTFVLDVFVPRTLFPHFLRFSSVAQLCLTLCNSMDCRSLPSDLC